MTNIEQKSGDYSINLQSGRDINFNIKTIVISSLEDLAKKILVSVFGELQEDTRKQIHNNQMSYVHILINRLSDVKKQGEEIEKIIKSPDFQYIAKQSLISAGRSSSNELHKLLASLVIARINSDTGQFEKVVFNEAIETVGLLTNNQLKILALCFLVKYFKPGQQISNTDAFIMLLSKIIKHFIDAQIEFSSFEHLAYARCLIINPIDFSIERIFKENHANFFRDNNDIDKVYTDSILSKLFSIWSTTYLKNTVLTSVGKVVACVFVNQVLGTNMKITNWIDQQA